MKEPIKQLQSSSDTAESLVKIYENETKNESEIFLPESYPFNTFAVLYRIQKEALCTCLQLLKKYF